MNDVVSHERSSVREGRLLKAQMQHPKLGIVDILIRNISEAGLGGRCIHGVEPGEWVKILLPNLPTVDGMIVWRMGDGFGVRLSAPIDPADVRRGMADVSQASRYHVPYLFRPPIECRRPGLRINC